MRPFEATALLLSLVAPSLAVAQDLIPKVEYQGGHAGMDDKVKGSLIVSDSTIKFVDEKGAVLVIIPITTITDVSSSIDRKEASVGSKIAFGFLARSRKEELVTVTYASTETAEGVVFKTEKNVSAGLVAKIQFHMKRAGAQPPTDSTAQKSVPHPPAAPAPGTPTQP